MELCGKTREWNFACAQLAPALPHQYLPSFVSSGRTQPVGVGGVTSVTIVLLTKLFVAVENELILPVHRAVHHTVHHIRGFLHHILRFLHHI